MLLDDLLSLWGLHMLSNIPYGIALYSKILLLSKMPLSVAMLLFLWMLCCHSGGCMYCQTVRTGLHFMISSVKYFPLLYVSAIPAVSTCC